MTEVNDLASPLCEPTDARCTTWADDQYEYAIWESTRKSLQAARFAPTDGDLLTVDVLNAAGGASAYVESVTDVLHSDLAYRVSSTVAAEWNWEGRFARLREGGSATRMKGVG